MANPATRRGYIKIANELAEQFALKNIAGNEMRLIWVVWRKTWGWKKDFDQISFSQFVKATGMKHGNVARSLKSLVAKRLLVHKGDTYGFNQDYETWEVAKRLSPHDKTDSSQKATDLVAKVINTGSQKATKKVAKRIHTIERKKITKENIKQNIQKQGAEIEQVRLIRDLIESFSKINPACKKMYGHPVQRDACVSLINEYGFARVQFVIENTLPKTNALAFFPTIVTPQQLFQKWVPLESAILKYKSKIDIKNNNGRGIAE